MKMIRKITNFLFGKKPPIFDEKGEIDHHRKESLKKWENRYKKNEDYNWKNHSGNIFKEDT